MSHQLYDPFSRDLKPVGSPVNHNGLSLAAQNLILDIQRRQAGDGNPSLVCAIHRSKGCWRWFSLATNIPGGMQVDAEYGGALNLAENLLTGAWRVGTAEEFAACARAERAARDAAAMQELQKKLMTIATNVANIGQ